MAKFRRPLLLLAVLALATGLLWRRRSAATRRPDVLIVTIDTLRPDAVGRALGTPAMADFFETATRFDKTRTTIPLTLPAHLSLFAGLEPAHHGVHDNVARPLPPAGRRDFPLLAEQMKAAGYATAAFVARGVLAKETGIAAGFDTYDCPPANESDAAPYLPARERVEAALAWLRHRPKDRPYFLWVHLFDCHMPRTPFPGDARRPPTPPSPTRRDLYEGEVRRVDAAIERLLEGVSRKTIVVLVSDHGEGLWQHGEPTHGALTYSTTLDILLAVRAPELAAGAVDEGLRSICDVAPTLRQWCSLPEARSDGLPLEGPGHGTVASESLYTNRIHGWGQCFASTDGRYTLVEMGKTVHLFDRKKDPGELHPIDLESLPAYETLDRSITRLRSTHPSGKTSGPVFPSVAPYASLRRPYSAYLTRAQNAKLSDPQPLLPIWERLEQMPAVIREAVRRKDAVVLKDAEKTIRDLSRKAPTSPKPHLYLAFVQAELASLTGNRGYLHDAVASEERAMDLGLCVPEVVRQALDYCVRAASPKEATAVLRAANEKGFFPDEETASYIYHLGLSPFAASSTDFRNQVLVLLRRCRNDTESAQQRLKLSDWLLRLQ